MIDFSLSLRDLQVVRDALEEQFVSGLAEDGQRVLALQTFLHPLERAVSGEAYVIDLGGSNIRGARISLGNGADLEWGNQSKIPLQLTRAEFVEAHVHALEPVRSEAELPLAYCFSYAAQSREDGDAVMLRMTKGVDFQGVLGEPVGRLIAEGLRDSGFRIGPVAVVNDTVASLFAAEAVNPGGANLGLIVGTGTNMASFFSPNRAPKLSFTQAVNLESGNADLPVTTAADARVDLESENPGQQLFEKAVSGRYLPRLFAAAAGDKEHPASRSAEALVALSLSPEGEHQQLAQGILLRSARLVGAKIAAVAEIKEAQAVRVLAEGGLFWSCSFYSENVQRAVAELGFDAQIFGVEAANIKGSAAAVLGHR